jgi:alkylhydroperoxidase/carboxymuconolactone decarboxylase family protein YurZ
VNCTALEVPFEGVRIENGGVLIAAWDPVTYRLSDNSRVRRTDVGSKPPKTYEEFASRFPGLAEGWDQLRKGAQDAGPLDERTLLLVKLAITVGAQREGALHSAVRRARAGGASDDEIEQVIATAATTIGLPSTVAAWTWARDELKK